MVQAPDQASEAARGLDSGEARARLAADGPNLLPASVPKSGWEIALDVLREPMFLLLLASGGLYLVLGDRGEAAFLLGFVLVVIAITLVQEHRTQRALEALRELSAPRALVLRDGRETRIAGRDVVRGDCLILHEGDRIAADARLLEGELEVDESLLTGESVPVARRPGWRADDSAKADPLASAAIDRLHASTVVTRGIGLAQVTATGARTAVGRIGADLAATAEPDSALQLRSRGLVRVLGLLAFLLAAVQVLLAWWWNGRPLIDSLLSGIALAMAILPEEIPVVLTVLLALGAWRIARRQVLTRRVTAVEALGAITVLAVDKTGTLTLNRMAVVELAAVGLSFRPDAAPCLPEEFHRLLEFCVLATPSDPFDPMEKAIQDFGRRWLAGTEHVHEGRRPETEYPLSPEILAMTRVFSTSARCEHLLATKGAPEAIADLCHLDRLRREAIEQQVEDMARRGLRVLGVACGRWQGVAAVGQEHTGWPDCQHDFDFEFLGLVALADPPRPEVPEAIAQCRRAGVRVVMMTGDHPVTACAIARQVGLSERAQVVTGDEMNALDDRELLRRLRQADICARLRPEHKLRLVKLLRADGQVVGMTGDGVNDAPALKAADVGIAMGERGTDVAREAAALVLLDDSFARIVEALRQGRRIYDNIRKATAFVFAVHLPVIALTLLPSLLQWPAMLWPLHIVLLELLIDPACSLVFEAEAEDAKLMERPPRPASDSPFTLSRLLPAMIQGAGLAAALLVFQAWSIGQGWEAQQSRTVVFGVLVVNVMLLVLANRGGRSVTGLGRNPWLARMALAVAMLLFLVLGWSWLRGLLGLALPNQSALLAAAVLLACSWGWLLLNLRLRA
jgi:P-type Ca2+ transporter type 2C